MLICCQGSDQTAGVGRKIEHLPVGFVLRCSTSGRGHPFLIGGVGSPTDDAVFALRPFFHRDKVTVIDRGDGGTRFFADRKSQACRRWV
jgi:hypothetical protein